MKIKKIIAAFMTMVFLMGIIPADIVFAQEEISSSAESDENFNPDDWIDDSLMHDEIELMSATKVMNRYTILALDISGRVV